MLHVKQWLTQHRFHRWLNPIFCFLLARFHKIPLLPSLHLLLFGGRRKKTNPRSLLPAYSPSHHLTKQWIISDGSTVLPWLKTSLKWQAPNTHFSWYITRPSCVFQPCLSINSPRCSLNKAEYTPFHLCAIHRRKLEMSL